jgi:hypothetical protein
MKTLEFRCTGTKDINCSICGHETPVRDAINLAFFKADPDVNDPLLVKLKEDKVSLWLCPRCQVILDAGWDIMKKSYDIRNYPGKTGFTKEYR